MYLRFFFQIWLVDLLPILIADVDVGLLPMGIGRRVAGRRDPGNFPRREDVHHAGHNVLHQPHSHRDLSHQIQSHRYHHRRR